MITTLTGCSFFQVRKPIVEQGNVMTAENMDKLHTGMSPSEVADIMGAPVLSNIFSPNKMKYVYTYQDRTNPRVEKRMICQFDDGQLKTIEKI